MQLFCKLLALALCFSPIGPPPLSAHTTEESANQSPRKSRQTYQSTQLQGDERILHALNRFTFGPRPGDLEAVRKIGLDNWFEQQLHPQSLDLSDLKARLAQFPAMQWNTENLLYRLPSNALIRQAINGKLQVPDRGALHAVWENQIARVEVKQQEQQQKKEVALNQPQPPAAPNANAMEGPRAMVGESERSESPTPMAKGPSPTPSDHDQMMAAESAQTAPAIDQAPIGAILDLPPGQRLARLATMPQPDFDAFIKTLKPIQRVQLEAALTPEQREVVAALENPERLVAEELIAQRLTRDINSTAQLEEVMTDFWFNHFNIYLRKNETMPYELVSYERDVIRPRALGKFEDLLEAVAHSPAMLFYLDNAQSIGPHSLAAERAKFAADRRPGNQKRVQEGLNENYARELMELHTVGVNGGYTQADVTQVARILTGWGIDRPERGGGFEFNPNRHEPGNVKALGQKFKDHGEQEGRELLHYLATRPATARFIARKLAIRFVSDDPPESLVDRAAKTYLSTGGDISAMLRMLYRSPEFWSASVYRAKVKTPLEYVVSAVRASDAHVDNLRPLANTLRQMGMPLYGCVPPTGYDWKASTWVSTGALVDRMNFSLALAANRLPGITSTWSPQAAGDANAAIATASPNAEQEEARLESMIIAGGVSNTTRSAVLQQFQLQMAQGNPSTPARNLAPNARLPVFRVGATTPIEHQDQVLAGLLLGSPEFQRR